MPHGFSETPPPPYYAVIFTSRLSHNDAGYEAMGTMLAELAEHQSGYLGMETTRGADRLGVTVSYWRDEASILAWKGEMKHLLAQKAGIERWYEHYELRVAKVERAYSGPQGRAIGGSKEGIY
ncbi:MAG: antibiotic biosynthesis monooxygenase family protein [Hyphomonadaceae bacterium]